MAMVSAPRRISAYEPGRCCTTVGSRPSRLTRLRVSAFNASALASNSVVCSAAICARTMATVLHGTWGLLTWDADVPRIDADRGPVWEGDSGDRDAFRAHPNDDRRPVVAERPARIGVGDLLADRQILKFRHGGISSHPKSPSPLG